MSASPGKRAITIELPKDLYHSVHDLCKITRQSFRSFVCQALESHLKERLQSDPEIEKVIALINDYRKGQGN